VKGHPYIIKKSSTWSKSINIPEMKQAAVIPHDFDTMYKIPESIVENAM
jgi:hypothetical protein